MIFFYTVWLSSAIFNLLTPILSASFSKSGAFYARSVTR